MNPSRGDPVDSYIERAPPNPARWGSLVSAGVNKKCSAKPPVGSAATAPLGAGRCEGPPARRAAASQVVAAASPAAPDAECPTGQVRTPDFVVTGRRQPRLRPAPTRVVAPPTGCCVHSGP